MQAQTHAKSFSFFINSLNAEATKKQYTRWLNSFMPETVDHEEIKRESSDATDATSDASLQIPSDNSVRIHAQNTISDASDSSDKINFHYYTRRQTNY